MKCKCSLNNNYEIIKLCDIEKYNQKIREFDDKAWSQVTIPEKLTIPSDANDLKDIIKVYIDIKITSTKVINTPSSAEANIEGLKVTSKKLLVSGELCQKIIYSADNFSNSMNSVKFNLPFNTYIVIDENINIDNDKYCVYPCVEDVSVKVIDKRTLSKNITLFLFAHKITEEQPPPNNEFIFYDFILEPKTEIVRVSFDLNNKRLIATSTGNRYNPSNPNMTLNFDLTDNTGTITKAQGIVRQNENGTNFMNRLNNQQFEIGDLIFINYQLVQTVVLTDYPYVGEDYDMDFVANRIFRITSNGIVPTMLPNVISLNSINNLPIINIGFDTQSIILLPHSPTFEVANPAFTGQTYFTIEVKTSTGARKYITGVNGNQNGLGMLQDLINKTFEYGDIVELTYKEGDKVQITENPYPTSFKSSLSGTTKSFEITQTGLKAIN